MSVLSVEKICRVCMDENVEMRSIFMPDETLTTEIHLSEMIMAYTSVQVTLGDGLPEQICLKCASKVSETYTFKLQCERSDTLLRERFGLIALKDEYNEGVDNLIWDECKPEIIDIKCENDNDRMEAIAVNNNEMIPVESVLDEPEMDTDESQAKNQLTCGRCCKSFPSQNELNRHLRIHSSHKPKTNSTVVFVCNICQRAFARHDYLQRHKRVHRVALEVEAAIKVETTGPEAIDDLKANICAFICQICHKIFGKSSHLTRHMKTHAKVKDYTCRLCGNEYTRTDQFINHMNMHTGSKPHACRTCGKTFNQLSNLKDHVRTHNGEKPYLCSECGKGFNQLGNLRQHAVRHTGIKPHLCNICGSGFASKGELKAHIRKHTGAKPFVCDECQSGFTTSSSLKKHKRIHSGEKPYECDTCHMKFSRSGILARHKRTHTGEKPYVCSYCSKRFSQSNDLHSHQRIHTGEKPYVCHICGSAFRQSSALKSHQKIHADRPLDGKTFLAMRLLAAIP